MTDKKYDLVSRMSELTRYQGDFKALSEFKPFLEYVGIAIEKPDLAIFSHERIYKMVMAAGTEEYEKHGQKKIKYNFFKDFYGIDDTIHEIMEYFQSASELLATRKKILVLVGPPGTGKSSLANTITAGFEEFTTKPEGTLYTLRWEVKDKDGNESYELCPQQEQPLNLIPSELRQELKEKYGIFIEGNLCPYCQKRYNELEEKYKTEYQEKELLEKILDDVEVQRIVLSRKKRIGVGTYQPGDPKSQDETDLTGSPKWSKLPDVESEADPDAYSFDGEFNVANRGVIDFREIFKVQKDLRYKLLFLAEEGLIKAPRFADISADEVIISHTNFPEWEEHDDDIKEEALNDRLFIRKIGYNLKLNEEIKIYEKLLGDTLLKWKHCGTSRHIGPDTIKVASIFALLTRYTDYPGLTPIQKMHLYNGRSVKGFEGDKILDVIEDGKEDNEGLTTAGVSPRTINELINMALVDKRSKGCVDPIILLERLEEGFIGIRGSEKKERYETILELTKKEYRKMALSDIIKSLIPGQKEAANNIAKSYLESIYIAYGDKIRGDDSELKQPDEKLMEELEQNMGLDQTTVDEFRRSMEHIARRLTREGKEFGYDSDEELAKAIDKKIMDDARHSLNFQAFVSTTTDAKSQQEQAEIIQRLIRDRGYCEIGARRLVKKFGELIADPYFDFNELYD